MDGKRTYSITINGIQESIKQVDALSDAIQFLEKRINELESKNISLSSSNASGKMSQLQTEDKLLQQIQKTEQQIADTRREEYQALLADKDLLREAKIEAEERAAAERLAGESYANTMRGVKQELADIKSVMQQTDLGSEKFQQLTERANELNTKLKQMEEAYGQFGRNVGNYKSAFDDMKKVTVQVGETTREFNSVRDASRQLTQELKAMVINGQEDTKEFEELSNAVHDFEMATKRAESAVEDLKASSKGMDDMLDMMESFTAMGQVGQGFTAFFGIDSDEIERSIQKLVALQNVLQGIEKIKQQMNTQQGIGAVFASSSKAIDQFVAKLTGAKITMEGLTKTTKAGTIAVRAFSTALKGVGIGFAMVGASKLISKIEDVVDSFDKAKTKAKMLEEAYNSLDSAHEARLNALEEERAAGLITTEEYYNKTLEEENKNIQDQYRLLEKNASLVRGLTLDKQIEDVKLYKEAYKQLNEALSDGVNYWKKYGEGITGFTKSMSQLTKGTEEELKEAGMVILSDWLQRLQEVNQEYNRTGKITDEMVKKTNRLYNELINTNSIVHKVFANLKNYAGEAAPLIDKLANSFFKFHSFINFFWKKENKDAASGIKKTGASVVKAESEYEKYRIQNMEEGLEKRLALIEYERKEKLKKLKKGSKEYEEIDKFYDQKILDEKEKWAYEVEKVYLQMWEKVYELNQKNSELDYETTMNDIEKNYAELKDIAAKKFGDSHGDYSTKSYLTIEDDGNYKVMVESDKNYTKRLKEEYETRTKDRIEYYNELEKISIDKINEEYEALNKVEKDKWNAEMRNIENNYKAQDYELLKHLEKGELTQKQYDELKERLEEERRKNEGAINLKYNQEEEEREKEHNQKILDARKTTNESLIENYQQMMNKLQSIDTSSEIRNGLGFTNVAATKKRNNQIIALYKEMSNQMVQQIKSLEERLENEDLTEQQRKDIQALIDKLKELGYQINTTTKEVETNTKEATGKLMEDIKYAVQEIGNALSSILGSIWDAQDAEYERAMEQLDKDIDAMQDKYDEMDALAEEHASNMESLEDKIANAQGDARDRLIERYNAEKMAQKQALADKKKAEKEQEKLEAKKEKMEIEQRKREKRRSLTDAIINTALMVTVAGLTKPFLPTGLIMMATAAAAGAAQIATIASQNYGQGGQLEGGLAQGNRHRDGGIKVLGGHAEIEGGEFVTNRLTTSKNLDLLEFINSKHKKIDVADLIDFYGGNTVRKNIQNVRTKFEDGGQIPTLSAVDTSDRIVTMIEQYAAKPTVVQVVDIIDRTKEVNEVKVLAGLSE